MEDSKLPLELVSSFLSIVILISLLFKYYQYKKKLDVLKGLNELKEQKKLTQEDNEFIKKNYKDYKYSFARDEQRLKLIYPVFILIVGILLAFLPFQEAMIHLNVVVVAYIYLQVNKIHTRNFLTFLDELKNDLN
ncbi:MAG: hypothetical protein C0625_17035 [Arcobacter sp.]|nr:MAG: hypothetical protein C0625_17035 [Arcobacter sp.]